MGQGACTLGELSLLKIIVVAGGGRVDFFYYLIDPKWL
jgi:hypothetical protein